jgi:hypothetical protein
MERHVGVWSVDANGFVQQLREWPAQFDKLDENVGGAALVAGQYSLFEIGIRTPRYFLSCGHRHDSLPDSDANAAQYGRRQALRQPLQLLTTRDLPTC